MTVGAPPTAKAVLVRGERDVTAKLKSELHLRVRPPTTHSTGYLVRVSASSRKRGKLRRPALLQQRPPYAPFARLELHRYVVCELIVRISGPIDDPRDRSICG